MCFILLLCFVWVSVVMLWFCCFSVVWYAVWLYLIVVRYFAGDCCCLGLDFCLLFVALFVV